ncbi:MAG: clan AA aspartic protease [Gammaproteobacteria bacterium]|nr:clan AA aspartic protease [Gammaproteobacteria bacterium]NBT43499.1 clan AA aspartic protease [Gammaproteobacteria bacterium]NBY23365.1 clan AA aspartic protease [Gammaproteobacteria bacterium]NDE34595.1 clan AA aspartic protease [Gammaproteobacteria bacterium]NDE56614.1 clan AA aspartic protease [Gammaproteobacteria bacterium]
MLGIIRSEFRFSNPSKGDLAPIIATALVDTGALHLCLPEHLAIQLGLLELERREVTLANGHRITVPYCGPVEIHFKNRRCFTGAMVLGDEPLLGAIPMDDMDLVVIPARQTVDVNPQSPHIPLSLAK